MKNTNEAEHIKQVGTYTSARLHGWIYKRIQSDMALHKVVHLNSHIYINILQTHTDHIA